MSAESLFEPPETILGLDPRALLGRMLREQTKDCEEGGRLGDYVLLRRIAQGGMGVVYEARQVSLQRRVAVKMISGGLLATDAEVKRFRLEAEAAAGLDHPGIVPIYEIGEDSGQHFFSMKLVEGGSLADLSSSVSTEERRGGAWARRAAALVAQMARAVHHAHRFGVLHRDIKPTNVLLEKGATPLLTDFGLAKLTERDTGVTLSMTVMGTPGYMSPEQASGNAAQVTPATDIYGLGAVLYDLLNGSAPFAGGSTLEVLRMVQARPPASLRKSNPGLGRDLEIICLQCLQKEPARRYVSAEELAADLDRWLAGKPILARAVALPERAWLWCRRNPAAAFAGLLLLTLAVVATVSAVRLRGQRNEINETLHASLLTQAHAQRTGTKAGRRAASLAAMEKAAAIHPSLAVRNEVIAALALTDFAPPVYWYRQPKPLPPQPEVRLTAAGDRLAVLDPAGGITVMNRASGAAVQRLATPPDTTALGDFSPDGRWLAAYDARRKVFVWDLHRTGPEPLPHVHVLPVPCERHAADFTPDSRSLALAGPGRTIHFYQLESGTESCQLTLPLDTSRFCFSPAGDRLAAACGGTLLVWKVEPPGEISRHAYDESLSDIAWHPAGRVLAASYYSGEMQIFDSDRNRTRWLSPHLQYVNCVRFDSSGTFLMSTSSDSTMRFTDPATARLLAEGPATGSIRPVRDGHAIANLDDRQNLLGRDVLHSPVLRTCSSPATGYPNFSGASFSPDGRWLVSGESGGLHVWSTEDAREAAFAASDSATRPRFHPDGRHILSGGRGRLLSWPVTATASTLTIGRPASPVETGGTNYTAADFTPDGRLLAVTGDPGSQLIPWPEPNRKIMLGKGKSSFTHDTIAISPDGAWVAGASVSGAGVTVFNAQDGTLLQHLIHNENAGLAVSPDGATLATATAAELILWDTSSWQPRHRLATGLPGSVQLPLAWSHDGTLLAVALTRQEIHLLDPKSAAAVAVLTPPLPVNLVTLAWSQDDRFLAAQTLGPVMQLWDIPALRQELRARGLDW